MDKTMLESIRSNNHRDLSRAISRIINDENLPQDYFVKIYPYVHETVRIGVTGPPGVGKSSLVDKLIIHFLSKRKSVGVIAVDPTSPFSGGALLGDRIRMNQFFNNMNVFIRSMGSHKSLGGLAKKAIDVGDLLSASGKDIVIYETVGIGQAENDIIKAVDLTLVVLMPGAGDEIQLMKAGLMEIADIFVINKSDKIGANRLAQDLQSLLHGFLNPGSIEPPVINTTANTGDGVNDLCNMIETQIDKMKDREIFDSKRLERHRDRVRSLITEKLLKKFWSSERIEQLEKNTSHIETINSSPYEIAKKLINSHGNS